MSSDSDFEDFQVAASGASDCQPIQAGSLKKGDYVMLKQNPCKITWTATSKPGKHGSAKISVTGVDIFSGKKYEEIFSTASTAWVPIIQKVEYEVCNIAEDDFITLLDKDMTLKENVKLPNDKELRQELKKCWQGKDNQSLIFFTVISACGQEKVISCRVKEIERE